jgi:hypothetical protein
MGEAGSSRRLNTPPSGDPELCAVQTANPSKGRTEAPPGENEHRNDERNGSAHSRLRQGALLVYGTVQASRLGQSSQSATAKSATPRAKNA